jgi:hypothetical protein
MLHECSRSALFTQEVDTNRPFQFQKRSQLFVGVYNEALTIAAMCVSHEDRSPFAIHGCDASPTPSGFAETVSDVFQYFTGLAYFY